MKIVIVGASGTIGKAVTAEISQRHEVITAGRSSGDIRLDLTDSNSIRTALESVGSFDALISTAGKVHFGAFDEMNEAEYQIGLENKLMGQVNLVLIGRDYITDGGSFT